MPSFKVIGLLILEKKILMVFAIYSHDGHLSHVTLTIYSFILSSKECSTRSLALIGQVVSMKKIFDYFGNIHVYCLGVGADLPLGIFVFRIINTSVIQEAMRNFVISSTLAIFQDSLHQNYDALSIFQIQFLF